MLAVGTLPTIDSVVTSNTLSTRNPLRVAKTSTDSQVWVFMNVKACILTAHYYMFITSTLPISPTQGEHTENGTSSCFKKNTNSTT